MGALGRSKCAMKRILTMCAVALIALVCSMPVFGAKAEQTTGILKYTMELSNNRFTGPDTITVTIEATNISDKDMPGPVSLYYPNGDMVLEFGSPQLAAGESQSWTGTWDVTQAELERGRVTFGLCWYEYNSAGELGERRVNFFRTLIYTATEPSVEVNRIIAPSMAREGQEVNVTYEIINTGSVNITNVTIRESKDISATSGTIESVRAGERASYTFTVKMGKKDLTSNAAITYRVGNNAGTMRVEDATIKKGEIKLNATLKADKKGGVAGDVVKLTLTLKNSGNADYQNVTVTDALLGEIAAGTSVPANKTVTIEKEISITGSADYQFLVTGQDVSGESIQTATERVSITELDPAKTVLLSVDATADRDTVYSLPGTVRVKVRVTNESAVEAKNVVVSTSGVRLHTFDSMQPGETKEFTRDVSISMAGQFRFDASVVDEIEQKQTFESNIIQIQYSQPTNPPTEAPIVTPPAPVYEELPTTDDMPEYVNTVQNIIAVVNHVALILAGICLALVAVGVVRRIQANSRAKDHLERSSTRSYDMPAPKEKRSRKEKAEVGEQEVKRPVGEDAGDYDIPEPEVDEGAAVRDGALMEETLRQLYKRADRTDGEAADATEPVVKDAADGESADGAIASEESTDL